MDTKAFLLAALLASAPAICFGGSPTLLNHSGRLEYQAADGKTMILGPSADLREPTLSPDGRTIAYIRVLKPQTPPDLDGKSELWIADGPTGEKRRLLQSISSPTPEWNLSWFGEPIFSLDGKSVYVTAVAWGAESAVHQVDIATGEERFVAAGGLVALMRTGPYTGDLLVRRHTPWPEPKQGFHYPVYVIGSDGHANLRVPNMDSDDDDAHVRAWLAAHDWSAW